jgi:hypothetical protein
MIRFIIKYVVLLINQKDYEHFLSWVDRLAVKKFVSQYIDARASEIIQSDVRFFYSCFFV